MTKETSTRKKPDAGLSGRFSRWIVGHPGLALILALAIAVPAAVGLPRITSDFTHRGFFRAEDPLLLAVDQFERRFGNDDSVVLLIHSPSGIFDRESVELLHELTERMWRVPEVIRVQSLSNFRWVHATGDEIEIEPLLPEPLAPGDQPLTPEFLAQRRQVALEHEQLPGWLVSEDGKTTAIFAYIRPGIDTTPDMPLITSTVEEIAAEVHGRGGDHQLYVTGRAAVNATFKRSMQADMQSLVPLVFLLTLVFLGLAFRRVGGVLQPLIVILFSVLAAMGLMGWLDLKMTNTTSILPQILMAIVVADSVHVLSTFYERLRAGAERRQAAIDALTKNVRPTLLTTISTAVGFFSYAPSAILAVASLGIAAGLGTILAWLFTYLVLGPMLAVLPVRRPRTRADRAEDEGDAGEPAMPRRRAFVTFLDRRCVPLVIAGFVLVVVSFVLSLGNTVNSDPFGYFKKGTPVRTANDFAEEHLGGVNGVEIVIESGSPEGVKDPEFLRRVAAFQAWVDEQPGVNKTVSLIDILRQTHRALHGGGDEHYRLADTREEVAQEIFLYTMSLPQGMDINDRLTVENDALRMSVLWTVRRSEDFVREAARLQAKAKEMGLDTVTTGKMMLYQSMNGYVVDSFLTSISIAMVLISLLLVVALRSVWLGALALVANVAPLVVGGALIRLMGQPLDVGTVIVASVCLGIAVDDTIHFLADFERWRARGLKVREATLQVFYHTVPALLTTTVILVASFGIFALADFTPNRNFGVLTAGVLGTALIMDITLLPAMLLAFDRRGESKKEAARTETDLVTGEPVTEGSLS